MRGAQLARLVTFAGVLLLACAAGACANSAIAPNHDEPTPPGNTEAITLYPDSSDSKITLSGHIFGAKNDPIVILTHMQPNDQTAWYPYAQQLASNGYAALTFDFRGYGKSTGSQDYDKLDDDLRAVITYAQNRGRKDIFLVGASMGATTSLAVAEDSDVKAIVAISPPAKFEKQDALAAVPALRKPKLFLVSELDAPTLQFDELYAAAAEPKEKTVYPGKAHGTDLFDPQKNTQAAAVGERILKFLDGQR